jgi:hypothetical protein
MFKKYILTAFALLISTIVVAETMWAIIPGRPTPGGTTRWAWLWAKHMNNNIHHGSKVTKIDFKYVIGNRGKKALRAFHNQLRHDPTHMMVSHGGNATSTLLEDVGGYNFREYTPIMIHPGNMLVPVNKNYNMDTDKQVSALNNGGGSEPDHWAAALLVCPFTDNMDKFMACWDKKVTIVRGMKSGRQQALVNGELSVGRETWQHWSGNAVYQDNLDKVKLWLHHCQIDWARDSKTPVWIDDNNRSLKGMCFDDVFEDLHGRKPAGIVYDAYKLTVLWRDGIQKSLFINKNSPYTDDMVKITQATWDDPAFQEERLATLGDYDAYIGKDAEIVLKQVLGGVNKEVLEVAVRFVNDGLGYKASVKEELLQ